MALESGSRLGPYEIGASIGKGGMGEVYKARDSRVGRDVAVKISSEEFSERFEREARAIAALNHPNICTLYDVGPSYLVMEYIDGESPRGPMPVEEALRIAEQIAAALEAAHERGIVHRDLKPGNIKVRPDGTVKVLDFGLAKVGGVAPVHSSNSPTMSLAATQAGVVLGTAAYMSPEQARGKSVDHRCDIWAFGVVLYELLTGERLFQGEDVTEVLASVVKDKPDLSRVPASVRRLLEACLQKDPSKRLQAIGDSRLLLEQREPSVTPLPTRGVSRWLWPSLAAGFAIVSAIAVWNPWRQAPEVQTVQFELGPPAKGSFTNWMAISPDGRRVAFTVRQNDRVRLWVRELDSLEAKDIAETAANPVPFWSFDSRYLAYQLDGKLRRVDVSGGAPQILCDADLNFMGGAWSRENVIVFGGPEGLYRVSASGGSPERLTVLDPAKNESGHAAPAFLPGGRQFVYLRRSTRPEISGIYVGSVDVAPDQQSTQRILATDLNALYLPTAGRLLFIRENALMAQSFDLTTHALTGEATQIVNPVGRMNGAYINAAVAENGTLIYRTGGLVDLRQLIWYDRAGKVIQTVPEQGSWSQVALSRDGSRAVVQKIMDGGNRDLFTVDMARSLFARFTFNKTIEADPVFSPDGNQVVFSAERDGARDLYVKASNGATNETLLIKSPEAKTASDWSRGGLLLYTQRDPKTSWDLWILAMPDANTKANTGTPKVFLATPAAEDQARFSPDGHYVAYRSNESGRSQVYVRSFPEGDGPWQISRDGGGSPRWRADGKELFFMGPNLSVMAVDLPLGPSAAGVPHRLFGGRQTTIMDVAADGQRFLFADTLDEQVSSPIIVMLNALQQAAVPR